MWSESHGCFYEELSHRIAKNLEQLFDVPPCYNELCFYCTEGVRCPHHQIPQPRIQMQYRDRPGAPSLNLVNEIFNLQIDCNKYVNYNVQTNQPCTRNGDAKAQQKPSIRQPKQLPLQSSSSSYQSFNLDRYLAEHEQMGVKSAVSGFHPAAGAECSTDSFDVSAGMGKKTVCKDVEEIFIIPKRRDVLHAAGEDERQKYQRFRRKQYICDICGSAFTLKHNIQTHLLLYHPNNENYTQRRRGKRFRCLKCNMVFRTLESAQKHQKRQHEVRTRPKCEMCQKEFPVASLLREHIAVIHLNLRPFKCSKCSAAFGRQGCLRRHIMMRHLNYVYSCPYKHCTHPGFKCSKALSAHIRSIHTHIRPYKCDQCGKSFVRRNDLRVHADIHNIACEYACPTCGQMFQRRIHLQKHVKNCRPTSKS